MELQYLFDAFKWRTFLTSLLTPLPVAASRGSSTTPTVAQRVCARRTRSMFGSRSDPFDDVPQHCRPDRPSMFAARAPSFPWEEMSGGGIGPEQLQPPATGARSTPLTELAPNAMCFGGPATPPKAAAPKRPAALPAPRAAAAALVAAAPRQADPPPQPAASTCSSPGPQQPTDQSRRRKMLRPRCASGPAPPAAHAWAVKTPVDMDAHRAHTSVHPRRSRGAG